MTPEERLDRFWHRLRPRLLELVDEGHEIGFRASAHWKRSEKRGFHFSIFTRRDPERSLEGLLGAIADPDEALEGFLG